MKTNVCIGCAYYEDCGKPERPMKCMGYRDKPKEEGKNGTDKK